MREWDASHTTVNVAVRMAIEDGGLEKLLFMDEKIAWDCVEYIVICREWNDAAV